MKIDGNMVVFEHLTAIDASNIGEDKPFSTKAPNSFVAGNAPGECREVDNLYAIEELGKQAVINFNRIFTS